MEETADLTNVVPPSFYEGPQVEVGTIAVGQGVPIGIEKVYNPQLAIGGAFGAWGESYDNLSLQDLIARRLGEPLSEEERMDLAALGFFHRHHISDFSPQEHVDVEVEVGARFLRAAAQACGWKTEDVEAVLIGASGPVVSDYTERIARAAGIPEKALKVSVHKACDGSVGALHLALNPTLGVKGETHDNLAEELRGKKVLIGGIEGLSRFIRFSNDKNAMQFFGNGAGVIGIVPGETMEFLAGKTHEVYDEEGVLAVRMYYPHSRRQGEGQSNVEVTQAGEHHIRVAGLMHEPEGNAPIAMAGMMGMVKLFVRSGVQVVKEAYNSYKELMKRRGALDKSIAVAIVHHANLKINKLKEKHLSGEGISLHMPWLLPDFGNVSAASNMIAFLRQLPRLKAGDHVLIDGFGAGTYYDALVVALKGA